VVGEGEKGGGKLLMSKVYFIPRRGRGTGSHSKSHKKSKGGDSFSRKVGERKDWFLLSGARTDLREGKRKVEDAKRTLVGGCEGRKNVERRQHGTKNKGPRRLQRSGTPTIRIGEKTKKKKKKRRGKKKKGEKGKNHSL